jgi:hypothetical protein
VWDPAHQVGGHPTLPASVPEPVQHERAGQEQHQERHRHPADALAHERRHARPLDRAPRQEARYPEQHRDEEGAGGPDRQIDGDVPLPILDHPSDGRHHERQEAVHRHHQRHGHHARAVEARHPRRR